MGLTVLVFPPDRHRVLARAHLSLNLLADLFGCDLEIVGGLVDLSVLLTGESRTRCREGDVKAPQTR
jgi:hypothetical protein